MSTLKELKGNRILSAGLEKIGSRTLIIPLTFVLTENRKSKNVASSATRPRKQSLAFNSEVPSI